MACNCLNLIDDELREKNLRLTGYAFTFPEMIATPTLTTSWIDRDKAPRGKKNSPPAMFGSHCPFCGAKVEKAKKKAKTGPK